MAKRTTHSWLVELWGYGIGFVLSMILTLTAYSVVSQKVLVGFGIMAALAGLAFAQLLVQLIFFLHLGRETRPRWKLAAFGCMLIVLVIIVVGSLWIMHNLDYNMMHMPMEEMQRRMDKEAGF